MKRNYILLLALGIIAVVAVTGMIPAALGVSSSIAGNYALALQLISLFVGFLLAMRVSNMYNKELKRSFIFLSLFLLFYMISSPLVLWEYIDKILGSNATILLLLALQAVTYAMLITSCIYTVKVIEVRRMKTLGWIVFGIFLAFGVFIVAKGLIAMGATLSEDAVGAISNVFIRFFDMAIMLMLVPVFVLYVQHMQAKAQESITFTMMWIGLFITILSSYIIELATGLSTSDVAAQYFQKGSVLDAVNIFGYLLIATGLYAHMKYDEWGFRMIEKALG